MFKKSLILFFPFFLFFGCSTTKLKVEKPKSNLSPSYFVLHGFKVGQNIKNVKSELGEPTKIHKFPDGYVAYIYQMSQYNLVFEANNIRQDIVWAIQISGSNVPVEYHLNGISLGQDITECIRLFGAPDVRRNAIDEITKAELADTLYLSYNQRSNFSLEFVKNKLTSIKIEYKQVDSELLEDYPNSDLFLAAAKNKDYFSLTSLTFYDPLFLLSQKEYPVGKSFYSFYKQKEIDSVLDEVGGLDGSHLLGAQLRIQGSVSGYVYKFKKDGKNFELFYVKSFEGWVIYELIVY
ncbi:hypothetical protein [Leptospira sp. 'Mane']|uniref:hypothetical protein n=1 Tax=Leptospira sp. 'Mane' TaxID=3387407 RepID=UPI00398A8343